jgi:glycosyltransferase involved in cell wall biosynthesis
LSPSLTLIPELPGLQLWFAGIGPLEGQLRSLARNLDIEERVRFLGYIADMPGLYRDVDLVVQSSLTEGLPNVMLEVAYLGVPVVATDVGGTAEVIEHGPHGLARRAWFGAGAGAGIREFAAGEMTSWPWRAGRARIESEFSFAARTRTAGRDLPELAC